RSCERVSLTRRTSGMDASRSERPSGKGTGVVGRRRPLEDSVNTRVPALDFGRRRRDGGPRPTICPAGRFTTSGSARTELMRSHRSLVIFAAAASIVFLVTLASPAGVAAEGKITPDGLTYTFKLRQGIRFHDGSPLTSADLKATYEKIIFPPEGVRSIPRNTYAAVASIETPDATTIVFKLKHPSASLLDNLASPWNVIYPKKHLDNDPNYF